MLYTEKDAEQAIGVIYADAYLRYSDKNQDELSIEYQMEETQEYADKNGITIRTWYIDRAKSARKVAGRDEFYQYVETVRNGTAMPNFLVWRTNRAFRNSYESHIYRKLLRDNNITLISATQNIDEDTSSGRLVTNILADIDQYKSEEIGDHVTAASRSLVKRNPRVYMGQFPIFGYKVIPWKDGDALRQEYAINEAEQDAVKHLFAEFIAGQSLYNLAAWLNEQGHTTRRGNKWAYQTLRDLIKNDFYKGVRSYMKHSADAIIVPDGVPAIIDAQTWEQAQKCFKKTNPSGGSKPRRQKSGRVYALTGKVFCGMCGIGMCGKGGRDYQYYVCFNMESRKTCTCKRIRKEYLENYILRQIREKVLYSDMIDELTNDAIKIIENAPQPVSSAAELSQRKSKILSDLAEMVQMKMDKQITPELFEHMKKPKDAELVEIEKELLKSSHAPHMPTRDEIRASIRSLIKDADAAQQENGEMIKALFDQVVEKVVIDNASVTVTLALSLSSISHKIQNGSPFFTLCENVTIAVLQPERVPFEFWKRKK